MNVNPTEGAVFEVGDNIILTAVGQSFTLETSHPVENALVQWQSSDPAVVTVSEGVGTAVGAGNLTTRKL